MIEPNRGIPGVVVLKIRASGIWDQAPIACVTQRRRKSPSRTQFPLYRRHYLPRLRPDQHSATSGHETIIKKGKRRPVPLIIQRAIERPGEVVSVTCKHASQHYHARAGCKLETQSSSHISPIPKLQRVVLDRLGKLRIPEVIEGVDHRHRALRANGVVVTCLK